MEYNAYYYNLAKIASASNDNDGSSKKSNRRNQEPGFVDQLLIDWGFKDDPRPYKFKNTSMIPTAIANHRSADSAAYDAEFAKANPAKWYHHVEPFARGAAMVGLPYLAMKGRKHLLANKGVAPAAAGLAGRLGGIRTETLANALPVAGLAGSAGVYQFARTRRSRIQDAIKEDKAIQNQATLNELLRNSKAMRSYNKDMDLLERVGKPRKGFKDPLTKARHEALLKDNNVSDKYQRNVAFN